MTKGFNYDAFISYRHSELDSFVAETIHHELEKFKLPRNLVKTRGAGEKTRIERVFRDRDELPISADLSENITRALESSDFLIVICTPRLKESIWCKSEIESFISLRGRERVLAVLAEGEPSDSFPESITKEKMATIDANGNEVVTYVNVEPLAADVRGKSRSEIKKKIKEEVVRLASAIFECNYDEIKQRHHEQKLHKRIKIASGIAGACIAFGAFAMSQAIRISYQNWQIDQQYKQIDEQYTKIQDQYKEIEEQYQENIYKQSQVVISQAENYYNEGYIDDAKALLLEYIKLAGDKMPKEAEINYKYMLSKVLRTYDNGRMKHPVANLTMNGVVSVVMASPDYKYLAAADTGGHVAVWNGETFEKIAEVKCDFDTKYEDNNNYGFDVKNNFIFVGDNSVNMIKCAEGGSSWSTEIKNASDFAGIDQNSILVASSEGLSQVMRADGSIGMTLKYDEETKKYFYTVHNMFRSADDKYMFVIGSHGDGVCVIKVSLEDLTIADKIYVNGDSATAAKCMTDGRLIVITMTFGDLSKFRPEYTIHCFDGDSLEELWTKKADHHFNALYEYKGEVLAFFALGIYKYSADDFRVLDTCQLEASVSDPLVMSDGRLRLLLTNGDIKFQDINDFYFNSDPGYMIQKGNVRILKYLGGKIVAVSRDSNCLCIYDNELSEYASVKEGGSGVPPAPIINFETQIKDANDKLIAGIKEDKLCIYKDTNVEVDLGTSFVTGLYYDEKNDVYLVLFGSNQIEAIKVDEAGNKQIINTLTGYVSAKVIEMSDDYLIIDCDEGYQVINRSNYIPEALVQGYTTYYEDTNEFLILGADEVGYTIPFYSLDKLVEEASK